MLNTAAHFPSDTAAKVERALEQLSDINEAAINNDRTVTAATKVNGKGLTNTTGDINIYPNSVNANNGGRIQFHYNQGSTETAKIWENASGQVRIDGNLFLNGDTLNTIKSTSGLPIQFYNMNSSSQAAQRQILAYEDRGSTEVGEVLFYTTTNSGEHSVRLRAVNAGTYADLVVGVQSNGTKYTTAPTPATNDNSSRIATTAFVNNLANTLVQGTLTPTNLIDANYSSVYKQNHLGIISLSCNFNMTYANWTKFHIFTSSIVPKEYVSGLHHDQNGSQGGAFLEFETDGKVYVHFTGGALPTTSYIHGVIIFAC